MKRQSTAIVPATKTVEKNLKLYKQLYDATEEELATNFLLLPVSEFNPFITECAIYDASGDCIACAAPATDDSNEIIKYNQDAAKGMARQFKALWRKYKRTNP